MPTVAPTAKRQPSSLGSSGGDVPLLATGYHLSQPEFHRRFAQLPDAKRAELIEGVVFKGSSTTRAHAEACATIVGWLVQYAAETPGIRVADAGTVILDNDNFVRTQAAN